MSFPRNSASRLLWRSTTFRGRVIPSRYASTSSDNALSLEKFGEKHVTKGLSRIAPGVISKGAGSYVTFKDGKTMLDFTCGIGVTNLGHCHPKVSQAAAEQCTNIVHAQCGIAFHEPYLSLIQKLIPVMPHSSLDSFFFWNSGSEAVEAAMKLARLYTRKQNIICMQGAYHGRTFGAMAVTRSKTIYSAGVHPLMPGTFPVAFPYWHQLYKPVSVSKDELVATCLQDLNLALAQQTIPSDTAAIIVEPVLGEGGYVPAPKEFLQGLRDICDQHGILLIIDEVQTGFGRTGDWFAIQDSGVRPDILVIAKGLANGFPLSGVISRREITDGLKGGSFGGTYAGNAVSCAAANAVVEVMKEEKIFENVQARSEELFASLRALQADPAVSPFILEVRGKGLMVAVEFASPTSPAGVHDVEVTSRLQHNVPAGLASKIAQLCVKKGLLILTTSVFEVIRFIPPLNMTKEDLKKGCDIFAEAVREVIASGA